MDFKTRHHTLNTIIVDIVSYSNKNIDFNNFIDDIINKYRILDTNTIHYINIFKIYYIIFIINFTLPNMISNINIFNIKDNFYKKYGESKTRLALLILNSKLIVYHKMLITKLNLDDKNINIDDISNSLQESSCWDSLLGETDFEKIDRICINLLDVYVTKLIYNILSIIKYKIDDKLEIEKDVKIYLFKYFNK